MNRNLDNCYFRVERDGKWQSICFTDLTKEEAENVMKDRSEEWLKSLILHLKDTINEIGEYLNICKD